MLMSILRSQGLRYESQLNRDGHWDLAREAAGVSPLDGLDHVYVLARRSFRYISLITMGQTSLP